MPIVNTLLTWIIQKRATQIEFFKQYPHDVQNDWLKNICLEAKDTEWGKRYDLKNISSSQFKSRIPLQTYESLYPWIHRMMQGELNILWPGEMSWFAKSSGTTNNKSKYIPVSEESLYDCHYKGGKDMLAMYIINRPSSKLFTGKSLVLGGSHQISQLNPDSWIGDLSALLIDNLPLWVQFYQVPERSIALMDEWEEKLDRICEATMGLNITSISGIPTWMLLLIKKVMNGKGVDDLSQVWPSLEVYFHGAVSFTPYRSQFKALVSNPGMYYMETYNASEGFFGIQDQPDSDEMLLMLDYGIFYEFIPMEYFGAEDPPVISLDEVETGKNYAVVITTNGGLWRYVVGDTIIFSSTDPYRIRVSGRTRHYINAFGEELMIDNAEKGLAFACGRTGAIIKDYTAAPVYFTDSQSGCHEWLIEFEKRPGEMAVFVSLLDSKLKQLNSDYEAKRHKDMALKSPIVHAASGGTFYNWLKSKQKLGGQHKIPRLSNTRQYMDEILSFCDEPAIGLESLHS